MIKKWILAATVITLVYCSSAPELTTKDIPVKLLGYVTAVSGGDSLQILDDVIHVSPGTKLQMKGGPSIAFRDVGSGMLADVRGIRTGRHRFEAERITFDWDQFGREIHRSAYLEEEPAPTEGTSGAQPSRLRVDGELLVLDGNTKWTWDPNEPQASSPIAVPGPGLVGRLLSYRGVRQDDGTIAAQEVEIGGFPPPDAFQIPNEVSISLGKDSKGGVQFVEFHHKEKRLNTYAEKLLIHEETLQGAPLPGRKKVLPLQEVQDYVSQLGSKLVPAVEPGSARPAAAFRFIVVEEPAIYAVSFPDGTVLVTAGLLAALENEAQLAFVLSHEISHTLQAHCWRQWEDTRGIRAFFTRSSAFSSASEVEMMILVPPLGWVWDGYPPQMENQADRLAVENLVVRGYDPHQALSLLRIMIKYNGSAIWSNHDWSVLRGSFLSVQIQRRYPTGQFDHATVSTQAFDSMRDALGPVKVE